MAIFLPMKLKSQILTMKLKKFFSMRLKKFSALKLTISLAPSLKQFRKLKKLSTKADFIFGNPPFIGKTFQTHEQKADIKKIFAKNINPYLLDAPNVLIVSRNKTLKKNIPPMITGNRPADGGNLILSEDEKNFLHNERFSNKKLLRLAGNR